jgi:hypothetical protein
MGIGESDFVGGSGGDMEGSDIQTFCSSFQSYACFISSSSEVDEVVEKVVLCGMVEKVQSPSEDEEDAVEKVELVGGLLSPECCSDMTRCRTPSFSWMSFLTCSSV